MLRNRKHVEANKLLGVNRADEESDLALGAFTALQNYVPADMFALKKKRGVSPLNPTGFTGITTLAGDQITTLAGDDLYTLP